MYSLFNIIARWLLYSTFIIKFTMKVSDNDKTPDNFGASMQT